MQTVASVEPVELVEAHSMLQLHQSGTWDCPNQSIHVKQALDKEYGDIFQGCQTPLFSARLIIRRCLRAARPLYSQLG